MAHAEARPQQFDDVGRRPPEPLQRLHCHGAVALGQPRALGVLDQRHVGVFGQGEAEELVQMRLARSRRQQVVAADNLRHARCGVVEHRGEVIAENAVAAQNDQIVRRSRVRAEHRVDDGDAACPGGQPKGGAPIRQRRAPLAPLALAQAATRARICAWRAVRRRRRLGQVASGAVALVQHAPRREILDDVAIVLQSRGLEKDGTVPFHAYGLEVRQLA